jgi:hypothetical protein
MTTSRGVTVHMIKTRVTGHDVEDRSEGADDKERSDRLGLPPSAYRQASLHVFKLSQPLRYIIIHPPTQFVMHGVKKQDTEKNMEHRLSVTSLEFKNY